MNKWEKPQTKPHGHRQQYCGYQWEGDRAVVKGKRGQSQMTTEDLTLGGGHTVQYIDDVS